MNTSEMLRKLADIIDRMQGEAGASAPRDQQQVNPNQPAAVLVPVDVDHEDTADPTTMVPPLQQKLELLKKSVGVDNMYDAPPEGEADCAAVSVEVDPEQTAECGDDEMDVMRRNAGLSSRATTAVVASEDNDLEA